MLLLVESLLKAIMISVKHNLILEIRILMVDIMKEVKAMEELEVFNVYYVARIDMSYPLV